MKKQFKMEIIRPVSPENISELEEVIEIWKDGEFKHQIYYRNDNKFIVAENKNQWYKLKKSKTYRDLINMFGYEYDNIQVNEIINLDEKINRDMFVMIFVQSKVPNFIENHMIPNQVIDDYGIPDFDIIGPEDLEFLDFD